MRFRKLFICIFVAILTFNFTNVNTYAAEETKDSKQEEESTQTYTEADLRLLSALIYCEAKSEIYRGKIAVGIVVMNRVRSDKFPDTVKEVIYQKSQFSPVASGSLKKALKAYDDGEFKSDFEIECIKAAKLALSGVTAITINDEKVDFSGYLYFSGRLRGHTLELGNHQFK